MTDTCPHCNADLRDGDYSRLIGVEIPGVYDGVLYWLCPDCNGTFHRWDDDGGYLGKTLRRYAEPYIHGPREEPCTCA